MRQPSLSYFQHVVACIHMRSTSCTWAACAPHRPLAMHLSIGQRPSTHHFCHALTVPVAFTDSNRIPSKAKKHRFFPGNLAPYFFNRMSAGGCKKGGDGRSGGAAAAAAATADGVALCEGHRRLSAGGRERDQDRLRAVGRARHQSAQGPCHWPAARHCPHPPQRPLPGAAVEPLLPTPFHNSTGGPFPAKMP